MLLRFIQRVAGINILVIGKLLVLVVYLIKNGFCLRLVIEAETGFTNGA